MLNSGTGELGIEATRAGPSQTSIGPVNKGQNLGLNWGSGTLGDRSGEWPSGKAADSGSANQRFESSLPSAGFEFRTADMCGFSCATALEQPDKGTSPNGGPR